MITSTMLNVMNNVNIKEPVNNNRFTVILKTNILITRRGEGKNT